jgi:uncharacterized RDD family membrane protein YckC
LSPAAGGATTRDPRSIITPEAFGVSPELLGTPLAPPGKRLIALLIDLAVVSVITLLTKSFALVLGVVAAVFFVRAGFKRTPVKGSVFGRAMRLSVGCLGVFIAIITAALWSTYGVDFGRGDSQDTEPAVVVSGIAADALSGQGLLGSMLNAGLKTAFENAKSIEDAEGVAQLLIDDAEESGITAEELRETLDRMVPEDAAWAPEADALFERLLEIDAPDATVSPAVTTEAAEAAYRVLADTLGALESSVDALQRTERRQAFELETTKAALTKATSGGLFGTLRDVVDELGFGFGWASLYLTILLSAWNGQTVGKRMMGLRVRRLDGEPITWWVAFERAGGYAAGFATGLLGFAQVYWDANRQGIHDRIVGTVVVVDGAERVIDWEKAL